MMDEEEQAIINKDRELNPNCGYSVSMKTILRKNIQRSGDKYSANEFESPFGQGGDSGFGMFNDSQLFQFAEDILGSFLGSFGGGAPIVRDPSSGGYSQPALPPHKVLPNLDGNTKAPGQVVRRVEDI
eukprot:gene716-778_t